MAEREELEPGLTLDGSSLMQRASGFAGSDGLPWAAVARAVGQLRRLGWIDWHYNLWPNEASEPRPEFIDDTTLQRAINIVVTGTGLAAVAARKQASAPATQVNIVNSTVGQLALRDINSVDIFVILDAVERSLDDLDAPHEIKEEARGVIRQMRDASASIATSAAGGVLAAAVRHSIGLP
jgi:hypothetical protein